MARKKEDVQQALPYTFFFHCNFVFYF